MYGERFDRALVYAAQIHRLQTRKGNGAPYITHLLAVAATVGDAGGDEDTAIAALLHDAAEDQGGQPRLCDIRATFGPRVADLVEECSDSLIAGAEKVAWRLRKEAYIGRAWSHTAEAMLISLADKLCNARATEAELAYGGPAAWDKFKGGRDGMLWYWGELAAIYRHNCAETGLVVDFRRTIARIAALPT